MRHTVGLICLVLGVTGCSVETLIEPERLPGTENGVYTDSGRFFLISGASVYEVVEDADVFDPIALHQEQGCTFTGLVDRQELLYAACLYALGEEMRTDLLRLEPGGSPGELVSLERTTFPISGDVAWLNGMEFGPDGALYASNSFSSLSGEAAIYRITLGSESPLSLDVEEFLPADAMNDGGQGGGFFPNGIRFDGDALYYSRGPSLVRMRLNADGTHGPLDTVYRTGKLGVVVDDFDIAEGRLFIAETNFFSLLNPALFESSLIVTRLNGRVDAVVDLPFVPSSTAVRRDTLFGAATVVLTSVFNGGLYRIDVDR